MLEIVKLKKQYKPKKGEAVHALAGVSVKIQEKGLVFSVFAALMLSNFIGTSVARKKRDIGILRALGARSNDVYRIFLIESLIIGLINFILSLTATIVAIYYINTSLREGIGLKLTVFNFGIRQIFLILLISLIVSVIASFLPVHRIARKKPVDAISNK